MLLCLFLAYYPFPAGTYSLQTGEALHHLYGQSKPGSCGDNGIVPRVLRDLSRANQCPFQRLYGYWEIITLPFWDHVQWVACKT